MIKNIRKKDLGTWLFSDIFGSFLHFNFYDCVLFLQIKAFYMTIIIYFLRSFLLIFAFSTLRRLKLIIVIITSEITPITVRKTFTVP